MNDETEQRHNYRLVISSDRPNPARASIKGPTALMITNAVNQSAAIERGAVDRLRPRPTAGRHARPPRPPRHCCRRYLPRFNAISRRSSTFVSSDAVGSKNGRLHGPYTKRNRVPARRIKPRDTRATMARSS